MMNPLGSVGFASDTYSSSKNACLQQERWVYGPACWKKEENQGCMNCQGERNEDGRRWRQLCWVDSCSLSPHHVEEAELIPSPRFVACCGLWYLLSAELLLLTVPFKCLESWWSRNNGGHSDGREAPRDCLKVSQVFLDSSVIFEIFSRRSSMLLLDWRWFSEHL